MCEGTLRFLASKANLCLRSLHPALLSPTLSIPNSCVDASFLTISAGKTGVTVSAGENGVESLPECSGRVSHAYAWDEESFQEDAATALQALALLVSLETAGSCHPPPYTAS